MSAKMILFVHVHIDLRLVTDVRKLLNQLTEKQPLGQQTVLTEQKKTPNVHPLSPNKSSRKPADMKVTAATQLAQYEMARLLSSPSAPTVMCDGEFVRMDSVCKIRMNVSVL